MMTCCLHQFSSLFSLSAFEKGLKSQRQPGSKRTLANYLAYLQEAFFILCADKFSYSPRQRVMNPKKIFLMDPGFIALTEGGHDAASCPPPRGRILENVVAIELYRRRQTFHYYKNRWECDFIVRDADAVNLQAIQVCHRRYSMNPSCFFSGPSESCRL